MNGGVLLFTGYYHQGNSNRSGLIKNQCLSFLSVATQPGSDQKAQNVKLKLTCPPGSPRQCELDLLLDAQIAVVWTRSVQGGRARLGRQRQAGVVDQGRGQRRFNEPLIHRE